MPRLRGGPGTQTLCSHRLKLLLDENLSDRIVPLILDLYPGSSHVKQHELAHADDQAIWNFARYHSYMIVSKDADFHQLALLAGAPPKVLYLRLGNASTTSIIERLRRDFASIQAFAVDAEGSVFVIS